MEESSISSNGLVHGYGNHYVYSGNYMEDYQMGEHFWNFLTKEESKATYRHEEGDVEAGINPHFQNDFKNMIVYEQAEIEIKDCIDNDTDAETDTDEVEGYIDARFHIEEFQDMTADYSHVNVPDNSYIEVLHGKPTYHSHAQGADNAGSLRNHGYDNEGTFMKATEDGNREVMKRIGKSDHDTLTTRGFHNEGTALHHTLRYGHVRVGIAKCLVDLMEKEDLEIQDKYGYTALALAVLLHHNQDMLEYMIEKNNKLLEIGNSDKIPVVVASSKGFTDTTEFLYHETSKEFLQQSPSVGANLLNQCISLHLYGIARELLELYPKYLTTPDDHGVYPTHALAKAIAALQISITQHKKSSGWNHVLSNVMNCCCYILLGDDGKPSSADQEWMCEAYGLLQSIICVKRFDFNINGWKFIEGAMMEAAKHGLVKFIKEMLKEEHEVISINRDGKNMFWHAIMNRQEKVFNLIYAFNQKKDMLLSFNLDDEGKPVKEESKDEKPAESKDEKPAKEESKDGKPAKEESKDEKPAKKIVNILHFAAKCPSSSILDRISGPALQMQREVQWFKAVQDVTVYRHRQDLNDFDQTPYALFIEEHKELLAQGEEDMKETAKAATVVGGLIVTTMFGAALTVVADVYPAQASDPKGVRGALVAFLVCAALSLFSCTGSIIVFLGILVSRYSPEDFLVSLPRKFMIGFWTLFAAITTMMIAFGFALHAMLKTQKLNHLIIGIYVFSIFPVAGFVVYICPMLCEICRSTCKTVFDKSTRLPKKKPSF